MSLRISLIRILYESRIVYIFRWYNTAETGSGDMLHKEVWGGFDSDLPAEWESWLRFRRTNPPSDDEVMKVSKFIVTTKYTLKRKNNFCLL